MINTSLTTGWYSEELCSSHPHCLFVFGDNMIRMGRAGQATIRDCPNSFGIATKRLPSMKDSAFFSDQEDEFCVVENDLRQLYVLSRKYTTVVFPSSGIGTGLSQMPERSPLLYTHMKNILDEYFNIRWED